MISINMNDEIYSEESIEAAKTAYEKLADIDISRYGDQWKLTFKNCKYDEKQTVKEFENYLIGMENS